MSEFFDHKCKEYYFSSDKFNKRITNLSEISMLRIWDTYPGICSGSGGAIHIACFWKEYHGGTHPSPGLQLIWTRFSFS